jgi:transcriptional regulator of acetoin/glycerol metabolism
MAEIMAVDHASRVLESVKRARIDTDNCYSLIVRSWSRCVNDYAMNPTSVCETIEVPRRELERRRDSSSLLLSNSKSEMSSLFQQLANRDTVVVIADDSGIILDTVGGGSFARNAERVGMRPGGDWSEQASGTNGVGTCLAERRLVVVDRAEHFFPSLTRLSCTGAPIFDDLGKLAGVLDVTSESDLSKEHFRILIGMSAQTIENRLFEAKHDGHNILRLHSRRELVHTFHEGLIAVNDDGEIVAANQCALFQLGVASRSEVVGRNLRDIFNATPGELISRSDASGGQPVPVHGSTGRSFFTLLRAPGRVPGRIQVGTPWLGNTAPAAPRMVRDVSGDPPAREWGDGGIERDFGRALRVYERGVYVLLAGETGSGKEIFAKAMHEAGTRSRGPFVAVNCAAVPENLIESELFGYRGGAFTGASREGRKGRILAADKGTLLLDEIGDMPLPLQARLLRVLEEQEVTPLGGEASVKVDIKVICATHRDLREMVSTGSFRSDLYFRLAGFTVEIPPLRARERRGDLIRTVLAQQAPELSFDEAALARLVAFNWPGNLRQLRNVLQALSAFCEGDVIRIDDLPPEIRECKDGSDCAVCKDEAACLRAEFPVLLAPPDDANASASGEGGADNLSYLDRAEREALLRLLRRHRWNVTKVAAELGASRNTVYRKVNQFGLVRE